MSTAPPDRSSSPRFTPRPTAGTYKQLYFNSIAVLHSSAHSHLNPSGKCWYLKATDISVISWRCRRWRTAWKAATSPTFSAEIAHVSGQSHTARDRHLQWLTDNQPPRRKGRLEHFFSHFNTWVHKHLCQHNKYTEGRQKQAAGTGDSSYLCSTATKLLVRVFFKITGNNESIQQWNQIKQRVHRIGKKNK